MPGPLAIGASLVIAACTAVVISLMRPERGVLAFVITFGVLAAAAVLCWAATAI